MLKRLPRPATLLVTVLLPASLALAACGSDDQELEGFDAVSVSGDVGKAPELDWKGTMSAGKAKTKVLTEGDGAKLEKGDQIQVELTVVDGWTHKVVYDSYDKTALSTIVRVGEDKEVASLSDLMASGLNGGIEAGQTIGSRIAVAVGSDVVFGDYFGSQAATVLADLDIGNEDGMLFVADIVGLAESHGTDQKPAAWAPKVVETDGVPTSLDFTGTPKPNGQLQVTLLVKGDGPVLKSGQQALVNYLGQLRTAKKPFDESFSKAGYSTILGGANATSVKGWSQGLVGLPIGSRVLLEIPPKLGYGNQAQGKDIPANSTLYFVVDLIDVADPEPVEEPTDTASPSGSASGSPSATPSE